MSFYHIDINRTGSSSIRAAFEIQNRPMHEPAKIKRKRVGRANYDAAFSFTFVRHPYERAVSQFLHRKHHDNEQDFEKWIVKTHIRKLYGNHPKQRYLPRLYWPQVNFLLNEDEDGFLVKEIYRFERLEQDFTELCETLGVEAELPHRSRLPGDYTPYSQYMTDRAKTLLDEIYHWDFELLNYEKTLDPETCKATKLFEGETNGQSD